MPGGLEALLERPSDTSWEKFIASPLIFFADFLYRLRNSTLPPPFGVDVSNPVVTVVCISDTHNAQPDLPNGDLLLHSGDITQSGTVDELQEFINWLKTVPIEHKIVIAGNHDTVLSDPEISGMVDWGDITYLENSSATVNIHGRELRIHGSPWTPKQGNFPFQYLRSIDVWSTPSGPYSSGFIPKGTDILLTHGPPRWHLDMQGAGCYFLLQALWRVRPRLHVFGHIHAGHGIERITYSRIQALYESIRSGHGGWIDLLKLVYSSFRGSSIQDQGTVLVNAAIHRDYPRRGTSNPIVVYL